MHLYIYFSLFFQVDVDNRRIYNDSSANQEDAYMKKP